MNQSCRPLLPPPVEVLPGVELYYQDIRADCMPAPAQREGRMLCLDHCRSGRAEWAHTDRQFCYLGENDLQISSCADHTSCMQFPTGCYQGLAIRIQLSRASASLEVAFPGLGLSLEPLYDKFCQRRDSFVVRGADTLRHIFRELYAVPEMACRTPDLQQRYCRLKIAELLLFLEELDTDQMLDTKNYYTRQTVEAVKRVKQELCRHPEQRVTIQEVAARHGLSASTLKNCFRDIYGQPVASFIRQYRMDLAAARLRESDESVLQIAASVGYENPSKFAEVFRRYCGMSPAAYRQQAG